MPRSGLEDKNFLRELLLSFPQKACSCVSLGMQFRHEGSMVGPRSSMFGNGLLAYRPLPVTPLQRSSTGTKQAIKDVRSIQDKQLRGIACPLMLL